MAEIKLIKNKVALEDLSIGLGREMQERLGKDVEVKQINVSELLGALVVKTAADIPLINVTDLKTKVVIVEDEGLIYRWEQGEGWIKTESGIYVGPDMLVVPKIYNLAYNTQDGVFYKRVGSTMVPLTNQLMVVNHNDELADLPYGVSMALVKSDVALYRANQGRWEKVDFSTIGDPVVLLETLDELRNLTPETAEMAIVKGPQGGLFIYEYDGVYKVDNITVIPSGQGYWIRDYVGGVSVEWYGAKGDGVDDDTDAIARALANNAEVFIPEGTYKITRPITIDHDVIIKSNGAVLNFGGTGSLLFTGKATAFNANSTAKTLLGASQIPCDALAAGLKTGDIVRYTTSGTVFGTEKYSAIGVVANATGNALVMTDAIENWLDLGTRIEKYDAIAVHMSDITIRSNSSYACISLEKVFNSTFTNIKMFSQSAPVMWDIKNSFNVLLNIVHINNAGVDSLNQFRALRIMDSDNIVINNSILYGTNGGIQVANVNCSNHINITNSSISCANMTGVYALDLGNKGPSGVHLTSCKISGGIVVSGRNIVAKGCVITTYNDIKLVNLVDGLYEFNECTILATNQSSASASLFNGLIGNTPSDWWFWPNFRKFSIINCSITAANYNYIFRAVSKVDSIIVYSNNIVAAATGGIYGGVHLDIWGRFYIVDITNFSSYGIALRANGLGQENRALAGSNGMAIESKIRKLVCNDIDAIMDINKTGWPEVVSRAVNWS